MNAWTDDGRGRTVFPCNSQALRLIVLAMSVGVMVLVSSGCEISVDSSSSSSSSPDPNDVAQADARNGRDDQNTKPTDSSDVPTDPLKPDPLTPGALKPDSPTPDSPDDRAPNAAPSTPGVLPRESTNPGAAKSDAPKSDAGKPESRNPGASTPDSPMPDSRKSDSPSSGARAPVGPKKELLPIESTARSALAREPGIEVITFDDLNLGMQADMVFREFLLNDRVRELEGQKVRLIGYMHGGVSQLKDLREFVLLRNTECKFGPGGLADHLVRVFVKSAPGAEYTTSALQIDGVLKVNPFQGPDGNTWSVYDIEAQSIKVIRR